MQKRPGKAFQSKKGGNLGIGPKWGWDFFELGTLLKWVDAPLKSTWDFSKLRILFEAEWPPKDSSKQVEYENIGKKSINMSDIMVYFAMFGTTLQYLLFYWSS